MSQIYLMEPLSDITAKSSYKFGVMIISANADSRSYAGVSQLISSSWSIEHLLVLHFESERIPSDNPRFSAYYQYSSFSLPYTELDCSDDRILIDRSLIENKSVLLDITGFSIPNLLRVLYVLKKIYNVHNLHAIYTEPQHYVFNEDTYGSFNYLIGEREYRAVDEYYSSGSNSKELLLIFLGFDRMTSTIVKEAVDPSETILINGFPSLTPKAKDISILNNQDLIMDLGRPKYVVKTNNPFSTYNVLSKVYHLNPECLINVCLLGTKPMALGAGVFALKNRNIKLSYAKPKEYASEISVGISNTWYYYFDI